MPLNTSVVVVAPSSRRSGERLKASILRLRSLFSFARCPCSLPDVLFIDDVQLIDLNLLTSANRRSIWSATAVPNLTSTSSKVSSRLGFEPFEF